MMKVPGIEKAPYSRAGDGWVSIDPGEFDDWDEIERMIVPLARETVWYEPAQIQRRCREIQEHLNREQFIEMVGAISIANAICRIGVVTGHCE